MNAMPEGCLVPDFGRLLARPRVLGMLASYGKRAKVLVGPSGSGKSVAAVQYSLQAGGPVIWIDASGLAMSAAQLVQEIKLHLCQHRRTGTTADSGANQSIIQSLDELLFEQTPLCVVVDDLVDPLDAVGWRQAARVLNRHGSELVLTSRCIDDWQSEFACELAIVDASDLALTTTEAREALTHAGLCELGDRSEDILTECAGHIAFFYVLAQHVRDDGPDYRSRRSVSLEVWISRALRDKLSEEERHILGIATLLKMGTEAEMDEMGVCGGITILRRVAEHMPLVVLRQGRAGGWNFRIHDLVDGYYLDHDLFRSVTAGGWRKAIALLTERGDLGRAAVLLARGGDTETAANWLLAWGSRLLTEKHFHTLERVVETIPIGLLMRHSSLLLLWSQLGAELGQVDEALARSRAALSLAQAESDKTIACRSAAQVLTCLRRLDRTDEAGRLAAEIIDAGSPAYDELLVADALLCIGHNRILAGDWRGAAPVLERARTLALASPQGVDSAYVIRHTIGMIPAIGYGDFVSTSRILTPLMDRAGHPLSFRVTVRGNVAICLMESGRIHRSETLIKAVLEDTREYALALYEGSYQPVWGLALFARGETAQGLAVVRGGITKSIAAADESSAAQARVYLSIILRAAGHLDESLTEAERAFEHLSVTDTMQFRRLAALEVAASLLSLGDLAAARTWTEAIAMEGFSGNQYHELRADMILAEADRAEGRPDQAISRLARHSDYILSENPNWQIAMYGRAFPGLLGLVAAAIYPHPVPAHLLRMILPEHAEDCLGAARALLEDAEWRDLGRRLLGADEFAAYLQRDGLPLCHVRLFGGLELSIGGRPVRERDWKKRKARLLFAMLAIRRGQDVPRDQLFEYLWPEMDAERAKNNLYVVWSTMKAALVGEADKGAPCPYIESVGGVCRTVREAVRTDVDEFETLLGVAREAEAAGRPSAALTAYERVADLYRGDLLPGDVYDDWFAALRDHYRSSFVDAMLRATALLMRADDPGTALSYVRRAIQCDPFREDLFQAALRCQIAAGQRSSAIDTYFQCRDNLAEELGLDPSVETRALYDQILAMEDRPRPTALDPLL